VSCIRRFEEANMSMILVRTVRAITSAALIVGSVFVQHVARTPQPGSKHADLQLSGGIGSDLATYIIESGKPLLTRVR
jgi:hypothetical protein